MAAVTLLDLAFCPQGAACPKPCYMVLAETAQLAAIRACECFDGGELPTPMEWPDAHRWRPEEAEAEMAAWRDVLTGGR